MKTRLGDDSREGSAARLALLLLLIAYFALVWLLGGGIRYLDETNTRPFFQSPGAALAHAAILQYVPVNSDIRPTFVLLHLRIKPLALRR